MTISKSNFIVISITLIAILFLFQFSNISALYTSKATINSNADKEITLTASTTIQSDKLHNTADYTTAVIGNKGTSGTNILIEWCTYTKRTYNRFNNLETFFDDLSKNCKLLILDGKEIENSTDISILLDIAQRGIHIFFTSLPNAAVIEHSPKLATLLGIQSIQDQSIKTNGITLYEGFLLGGQKNYKHMKKTMPYFKLESGTKKYMVGMIKDPKKKHIKNEDLPPVIWRNAYKNSFVFSVNTDFFKDQTGLGILTAMWSETETYYLYPIVNAQSIVFENYPYLSNENKETIQKNYYYTPKTLCENILWPDITSILNATNDKFTGMITPQLEYNDTADSINKNTLNFYFKQTEKVSGELGISGDMLTTDSSMADTKIAKDTKTMNELVPSYLYTIFAPGSMPESSYSKYIGKTSDGKDNVLSHIRTIVDKKENAENILSFYQDNILRMAGTIDGFSHTDAQDLYVRSIETALGYSSINLDIKRVLYPENEKDDWTKLSKKFSSYLGTYWKTFRDAFDQTTISEADQKARQFFAVTYDTYRYDNTINLNVSNLHNSASFILNLTNEKVDAVSGGTFTRIEKDRYQISVTEKNVTISVSADGDWR